MKINSIPKSMTIIDNQLVAEMSDLEERSIKSEAIIIRSKITQCEKRTLSQSILDECIRSRTVE